MMFLTKLQEQLSTLYEAPIEQRVMDFLVTDAQFAHALEQGRHQRSNSERLLFRECENSLDITLYIDCQVLETLANCNPYIRLRSEERRVGKECRL